MAGGTSVIPIKYGGSWNSNEEFVEFSWALVDIDEFVDYEVFVDYLEAKTSILEGINAFRMFIELVTDCNVAKYVPFDGVEDFQYLLSCISSSNLSCAIIVEHGGMNMVVDDLPEPEGPNYDVGSASAMEVDGCVSEDVHNVHHTQRVPFIPSLPTIPEISDNAIEDNVHDRTYMDVDGCFSDVVQDMEVDVESPEGQYNGGETDVYIPDGYRFVDSLDLSEYRSNFNVFVNDIYSTKKLFKMAVKVLALKNNFQFNVVRSNYSRVYLACSYDACGWFLRASRFNMSQSFLVHTIHDVHSCPPDFVRNDHRQATSDIVAEFVKHFYPPVRGVVMKPRDIIEMLRCNHGFSISYAKAKTAREMIMNELRGSPESSYLHLSRFCNEVRLRNPGTYIEYDHDEEFRFKYMFMSLEVSIKGFEHCRPVLSVDGTFLKNKYGGTMLAAVSMDANNQIFPIAIAIVDSENDLSWEWFFTHLRKALGEDVGRLSIISDRHGSIWKAVEKVFPKADYGVCMNHLANNIKSRFRKKGLSDVFKRAARAFSVEEFDNHSDEMFRMEPRLEAYLEGVGLSKWARAYFEGFRFNIMTTNISESFNNAMTPYREFPIISLMEEALLKLQSWFSDRRSVSTKFNDTLSKWAAREHRNRVNSARRLKVHVSDFAKYMVSDMHKDFFVDAVKRECSCRRWQLELFPCQHACAVLIKNNIPTVSFVDYFYTRDAWCRTYAGSVFPTGRRSSWSTENLELLIHMLPPNTLRAAGRPRKRRIRSVGEFKKVLKCGRCKCSGHNRKTCQNTLSVVPNSSRMKK